MVAHRRFALSCALAVVAITAVPAPGAAQSSEATAIGAEWLGPHPRGVSEIHVRRPVFQGPGAMLIEQQEAEREIRSWWPASIADTNAAAIIDGFSRYLQTLAIERAFDLRYLRTAHSVESREYFGGHIIWSFPSLRLSRQAIASSEQYAAVFMALERWIGVANLQGAMYEVAHLPGDRLQARTIIKTISDAAGQDLSWAFDAATTDVNYAVDALSDTTVTVSRRGSGMFTGRAAPRTGDFDSGDALRLKVVFADGSTAFATWDGRDQTRTFTFQGPSKAIAAYLDPDRLVTLDRNRLDNAIVSPSPTNVPVGKWAARWMVWLQHTMLSYGFLA
jgi:hypothetical protein